MEYNYYIVSEKTAGYNKGFLYRANEMSVSGFWISSGDQYRQDFNVQCEEDLLNWFQKDGTVHYNMKQVPLKYLKLCGIKP